MRQGAPCLLGSRDALDVAQDPLRAKKLALEDFATHPEPSIRPMQRFQRILMSELDHIKKGRTCEDIGNLCGGTTQLSARSKVRPRVKPISRNTNFSVMALPRRVRAALNGLARQHDALRFVLRAMHGALDGGHDAERHADQLHGANEVALHIVQRRNSPEG